jgi:hypothetical protein
MRKLEKSETRLLLIFGTAVFLAFNLLAMRFWMDHRGGLMKRIAESRTAIATANSWLVAAEALKPARDWMEQKPAPLTSRESSSTDLLNAVRALAEKCDLKVVEETLLPGEEGGVGTSTVLQIKISGPFSGVATFLFDLQSPSAWRAVDKISVRSDSEPPNVVVDMEIRQYYRAQLSGVSPTGP